MFSIKFVTIASSFLVAATSFILAHRLPLELNWLVLVYFAALLNIAFAKHQLGLSSTKVFLTGWMLGTVISASELCFFFNIFSILALVLWTLFGLWTGLFVLLASHVHHASHALSSNARKVVCSFLLPTLWVGIAYFRSECWPLKFAWLSPILMFSHSLSWLPIRTINPYGIEWMMMFVVSCIFGLSSAGTGSSMKIEFGLLSRAHRKHVLVLLVSLAFAVSLRLFAISEDVEPEARQTRTDSLVRLRLTGLEIEQSEHLKTALDNLYQQEGDLYVLPEYCFNWQSFKEQFIQKLTIFGLRTPIHNEAFVMDGLGNVLHRQVKSVPIPFFNDGLPAEGRSIWHYTSPPDAVTGKSKALRIGICVCYDSSYPFVIDNLRRQGAQLIVVIAMDAVHWGAWEHELNARVTHIRAAQFGLPIYRLTTSGISQAVDSLGRVKQATKFAADADHGTIFSHEFVIDSDFDSSKDFKCDDYVCNVSLIATGLIIAHAVFTCVRAKLSTNK